VVAAHGLLTGKTNARVPPLPDELVVGDVEAGRAMLIVLATEFSARSMSLSRRRFRRLESEEEQVLEWHVMADSRRRGRLSDPVDLRGALGQPSVDVVRRQRGRIRRDQAHCA